MASTLLPTLLPTLLLTLLLMVLPMLLAAPAAHAQQCRWDGTAPWCSGSCGSGESEMLRTSDLPEHWKQAYPIVQNTNFGAACAVGSKALCCKTSPGRECRWDGTAPFCGGSCGAGEVEAPAPPGMPNGQGCATGQKKYCCRSPGTGTSRQRLSTNVKLTQFAAIWDKSPGPSWQARHGLNGAQYQQLFNQLVAQGYRPVDVSGYSVNGEATYAAIFEKKSGPEFAAFHGLQGAAYQREFDRLTAAGYKLVFIDGFNVGNSDRYNAIFEKTASGPWVARHNLDAGAYQREFDRLGKEGYRLLMTSGYNIDGQDRYAAIWERRASPPWTARHGLNAAQYQQQFNQLVGQGYRVVMVNGWRAGNEPHFTAIWEKTSGPAWQARHQLLADSYQEEFNDLARQGYRLRHVSGYHMYD